MAEPATDATVAVLLASVPAPSKLERAKKELEAREIPVRDVIRAYDDHVLFISTAGRAMVAWRWIVDGKVLDVTYESGWRAEPSDFATPAQFRDMQFNGAA